MQASRYCREQLERAGYARMLSAATLLAVVCGLLAAPPPSIPQRCQVRQ